MRFNKRLGGVIGALVMLLAGAAVVYAAFAATGTGSGRATSISAVTITIIPTSCATGADFYPGSSPGGICFTLTNSNVYSVNFTGVSYLPGGSAISSGSTTCPAAGNVSIATTAPTTVNFTVAGNTTSPVLKIPGVVQMALAAPNACQNVSFDVPIALNGLQQ